MSDKTKVEMASRVISLKTIVRVQGYFKALFFVLPGLIATEISFAQTRERIDSLEKRLVFSEGQLRFEMLRELFTLYSEFDYDRSFQIADEAVKTARQTGDTLLTIRSYRMKGYALMNLAKNPQAIEILQDALQLCEQNQVNREVKSQVKFILNSIALAYTDMGDYPKALDYHFRSLVLREEAGGKLDISISLNNIGLVYYRMGNYQKAKEFYQRCFDLKKEIDDMVDSDRLLINMALCYISLNDFQKAISRINEALSLCADKCSDEIRREAMNGLGIACLQTDKIPQARQAFLTSLEISRSQNNIPFTALNLTYLAKLDQIDNAGRMSETYFNEAEDIIEGTGYTRVQLELYEAISDYYRIKKRYQESLDYALRYVLLYKQSINEVIARDLSSVETNYAERANLKTIREQSEILQLKEEIIQRQRQQTIFVTVIACLGIALTYSLFRFSRELQRKRTDLSVKNKQLYEVQNALRKVNRELDKLVDERTKDLAEINQSLASTNDELDHFIYKTSHDIRGPLASLIGLAHLGKLEVTEPKAANYLSQIDATASKLNVVLSKMAKINEISRGELKPVLVDLEAVVNRIVARQTAGLPAGKVDISVALHGEVRLVSDVALIQTCLDNLIGNAIKYRTESVRIQPFVKIQVEQKMHAVLIRVIDNGIGIPEMPQEQLFRMFVRASERSETGGIGLYLARLSATRLFGKLSYSKNEHGHTVFSLLLHPDLALRLAQVQQLKDEKRKQEAVIRARVQSLSDEVL